ncbi:TPA: flagellin, partial [Campylobacter coli]|nr:flagellin [Campylobacter coli]
TGVEASLSDDGRLILTSREGRGIKVSGFTPNMGILAEQAENYGRLSLVKNDGRDIAISGTGLTAAGFGDGQMISQSSVSLRETKGQISAQIADAMGFNNYEGGGKFLANYSSVSAYMAAVGSGMSQGSGFSVGSGKNMSVALQANVGFVGNAQSMLSNFYNVSAGSGFSSGSGQSQFAQMKATALGATDKTAGVTTLK